MKYIGCRAVYNREVVQYESPGEHCAVMGSSGSINTWCDVIWKCNTSCYLEIFVISKTSDSSLANGGMRKGKGRWLFFEATSALGNYRDGRSLIGQWRGCSEM